MLNVGNIGHNVISALSLKTNNLLVCIFAADDILTWNVLFVCFLCLFLLLLMLFCFFRENRT